MAACSPIKKQILHKAFLVSRVAKQQQGEKQDSSNSEWNVWQDKRLS